MRVCVELEIDKPLRRGAYIASSDGERLWLTFKFERLPTVCFIYGKLGHDNKHCPMSNVWQSACHQYGDQLRAGWTTKETSKERNASKETIHDVSDKQGMQRKARLATGSSSECFVISSLEGGKQNSKKGDTQGRDNTTCVDGQLASDVRVFSGTSEQVMSGAARQVMSVLGFCEKSCAHLSQDISIEHGGSISHGPKGLTSQGPKGFISQGSPSIKASLDKNEKDSLVKKSAASTIKDGVIFQAKANEKGKQILGKGSLKKVVRVKGKASDD